MLPFLLLPGGGGRRWGSGRSLVAARRSGPLTARCSGVWWIGGGWDWEPGTRVVGLAVG
jgi:hypothetical protein